MASIERYTRFLLPKPYLAGSSRLQFGKSLSQKLASSLSTRQRPTELRVPAGMMGSGGKHSYMGTGCLAGLLCSNLGGVKETRFFLLTMERAGGYTRDSTCQ